MPPYARRQPAAPCQKLGMTTTPGRAGTGEALPTGRGMQYPAKLIQNGGTSRGGGGGGGGGQSAWQNGENNVEVVWLCLCVVEGSWTPMSGGR